MTHTTTALPEGRTLKERPERIQTALDRLHEQIARMAHALREGIDAGLFTPAQSVRLEEDYEALIRLIQDAPEEGET